ncbi:MAG: NAD-dependent epimerase/dehydratase family protein [bacterium]|nr:NAD-dependent epimerase/dehydratase family protein [bacterium]
MNAVKGKKVLITGGLGMIGSTIANKLVTYGAEVTILDSLIEPYGGNFFNVEDIKNRIKINISDIRDKESLKILIKDVNIIFNLAAQVSHNDSLLNPSLDADINYIGHLNVLEAVRNFNPEAKVLYSGSRLQFGKILKNPVNEDHPLNPLTPYALNKTAAENLYLYYHRVYNIPVVIFRIANPYGPRCQMKHSKYSIINWFIRNAMEGKDITIFGDGIQMRDYIFVDDLADAFISASVADKTTGEVFNVGSGTGTKFKDMVENIIKIVGKGEINYVSWPNNYLNVETGDYITDITKIKSCINWVPQFDLRIGILKTFEYYSKYRVHYW